MSALMLSLAPDGAEFISAGVRSAFPALSEVLDDLPRDRAGLRLSGLPALRLLLAPNGPVGEIIMKALGPGYRAVRAILFDKSAETNWSLDWHQDRTICVKRRVEVEGYGPWTEKSAMPHVAPPWQLLSGMITVRVHLDDVPATNAPLMIAPGSHRFGRIAEGERLAVFDADPSRLKSREVASSSPSPTG